MTEARIVKAPAKRSPAARKPSKELAVVVDLNTSGKVAKAAKATLAGVTTASAAASHTIAKAYPSNWLVEMLETPIQRRERLGAQAIATVLGYISAKLRGRQAK